LEIKRDRGSRVILVVAGTMPPVTMLSITATIVEIELRRETGAAGKGTRLSVRPRRLGVIAS
jgi:hypothetical protein